MSSPPSSESAVSRLEWKTIGKPPSLLSRMRDPGTLSSSQANAELPPSAPPDSANPTSPRKGKPSLLGRIDLNSPPTTAGSSGSHPSTAHTNGHTPVQDIFKIPLIHPTTVPTPIQNPKPAMSSFCISLPVVTVAPVPSTTATPMQVDAPSVPTSTNGPTTNPPRPPPTTNGAPSSSLSGQRVASSLSTTDLYKHISAASVERMELDEVHLARKHVLDAQQEYLRRYEETRSAAVREKEHMDKLVSAVLDALAKTEKVQERQEKRWAEENERLEKLLKAKEEEERRLREEEAERIKAQKEKEAEVAAAAAAAAQKAKEEAEAAAKAAQEKREAEEAEARARAAAEEQAKEEALAAQAARERAKAEEERQEQERRERLRREAEAKAKAEAEERSRLEAEARAAERSRLEAEAKAKEEQALKARELRDRIKAKEQAQAAERERERELYQRSEEEADRERVRAEARAKAQEAAAERARRLEEDRVWRTSSTPIQSIEPLGEGQGAIAKLVSSTFATSIASSQISIDGPPQRLASTTIPPSTSSTDRIGPEAHGNGPTITVHFRPSSVLNSLHSPAQTAGASDSSRNGRKSVMTEVDADVKPPPDLAPPSTSPLNRPMHLVAESIKTSPSMSSMKQPRSLWPPSSSVGSQATSSGSVSRMDVATLGTAHVQTRTSSGQNGVVQPVKPISKNLGTFIKPEPIDVLIPPTPMPIQAPQPPPRTQQPSRPNVTSIPAPPLPPQAQSSPPAISAPLAEILDRQVSPRAVLPPPSTPVQPAARQPPPASLPQKPTVLSAPVFAHDEVAASKATVPTLQSFNSKNGDRSGRPSTHTASDVNRPPSTNAEHPIATDVSPLVRVSEPQRAAPPAAPTHWRTEHDDDAWVITPGGVSDRHSQRYRSPTPDRRYDHYSPEPERYPYPPRPSRYEPPSPPGRKRHIDSYRNNAPYKRPRYDERSRSPHSRRAYSGSTNDRPYTPASPRERYRPPPRPVSPMARRSPVASFSPEPPISPYQSSIGSRRSVDWSLPDPRPYPPELRQAGPSSSARQLPPPARPLSPARRPFIPPPSNPPPPPLAGRMSQPSQNASDGQQRAPSGKKAARPRIDTNPSSTPPVWRGKPVPVPVPTSTRDGPPVLLTRMSNGGPRHGPPGSEQGRPRRGNARGRGRGGGGGGGGGNAARGGRGGYRDLESRITG